MAQKRNMTPAQKRVFDVIRDFIAEHEYPPVGAQIAKILGLTEQSVSSTMQRLERDGYIAKERYAARTIRILRAA